MPVRNVNFLKNEARERCQETAKELDLGKLQGKGNARKRVLSKFSSTSINEELVSAIPKY